MKEESQRRAREDHRAAPATSGSTRFRRMPTPYCYLCCGDLRSPGVTDYATMMMMMIDGCYLASILQLTVSRISGPGGRMSSSECHYSCMLLLRLIGLLFIHSFIKVRQQWTYKCKKQQQRVNITANRGEHTYSLMLSSATCYN